MYHGRKKPKPSELAAIGLRPEDVAADEPIVEVWPDNWPVVTLFEALGTQWRTGFAGASGLDYAAIEPTLRLMSIPDEQWPHLFWAVRVMEIEALDQMRLNAEAEERARGS